MEGAGWYRTLAEPERPELGAGMSWFLGFRREWNEGSREGLRHLVSAKIQRAQTGQGDLQSKSLGTAGAPTVWLLLQLVFLLP